MGSEPAARESAPPSEPLSVLRGTVQETASCLLTWRSRRFNLDAGPRRHGLQALSNGVLPDAMCGGTAAVATTQFVDGRGGGLVDG